MPDMIVYVVGVFAFFVAVGCFSRWLEFRSMANERFEDIPFVALRSPSRTNAFDRRIEAALRDASRGFRLCHKCLFTNRSATESCVLCGCALSDEPSKGNDKDTLLTRRQRRARTRKRWVRRIDNNGDNVVWSYNDDGESLPRGTMFPVYVLRLTATAKDAGQPEMPQHVSTTVAADSVVVQIDASDEDISPPAVSLHDVGAALQDEASHVACELVRTRHGSAAEPHVHLESDAASEWKDAAIHAATDFPTKLAQFVTATSTVFLSAALQADGTTRSTRLNVRRDALLSTSIGAVATMNRDHARAAVRVDFEDEQGIDAGGVYREWFVLLNEEILAPGAGIFTCVDPLDQVFYLNPHSQELLGDMHLAHFLAAGRLLGRALLDGNVTGFHLALPLLKIILGEPVGFLDLEYFDPEVYKNLQWLVDHDGVDALALDFTTVEQLPDGSSRIVDLVPNGRTIDVTDANKREFIDCKLRYLLVERVRPQLVAFLRGLYDIVPPQLLVLLDAEELDHLLAGSDDIDVDDWQRNSQTSGNLLLHPALTNFWSVVRALSLDERRRLLQFATGATRVPPGGFAALTSFDGRQCAFTLHGVALWRSRGYLRSHACFNRLDLPLHTDLLTMRRAVEAAIAVDAFGFTAN